MWQLFPSSLPGMQEATTSLTIPPGVSVWGKGQAPAGYTTLDAGPGIALGDGTLAGGKYTAQNAQWIKISLAQLAAVAAAANQPVQFYELNTCEGGDPTTYRTFLCTPAYHH
jgi:hypothetical protein